MNDVNNSEWIRLTPHPNMTQEGFSVFYLPTPNVIDASHELAYGFSNEDDVEMVDEAGPTLFLSDAEALAFAAQLAEVKALIKACAPATDDFFGVIALEDAGRYEMAAGLRKRIAARRAAFAKWESPDG